MNAEELKEEINIELESLAVIADEITGLKMETGGKTPSMRDKTAAGAFLAQFYNGVENILKRICRFYGVPLPDGANWHIDLFRLFCEPGVAPLPELFDKDLRGRLAPYRNFRHIFFHSYGFQLDWEKMRVGIENFESVFFDFKKSVQKFLMKI